MMKAFLLGCLMTVALTFAVSAAPDDGAQAQAAAQAWLALVDGGKYADSWTQAAAAFRAQVDQNKWVSQIKPARDQFGPLVSRKPFNVNLTKSLPGAPDGDYAITRFQTDFANKKQALETVVMTLENGQWRVGGYFIK
jgi:opacity protein-like surface antigen